MRLRERDKREIWVSTLTGMHDDVYTWGNAVPIRAALHPLEQVITSAVYGDTVKQQYLLLYDGKEKLCAGMGVSLDGGTPAYRIVKAEGWSHVRAVIERIPEGRRA